MPGRMGADRITVKNLKVMKIDKENNLLVLKGAVPGHRGTLLEIKN
jgi:large subunit ribosomal protein L3